ncbi:hypothetical protein [Candidatus Uabimicrobium amorphum]|uniref:Uncharacterized protein n=1 Tax=Uabimicrobium amorphum TaxID=2596890 RepID=A0A5S9IQQ4_UABAM|nr:hypothetical protein [Candidatus Uabimicrobium amorphum]BBM86358.1 hypothetical protein UABAM_04744 [Candidatus Uabimicrobium amorphum]
MNPYSIILAATMPIVIWAIFTKLRLPFMIVFSLFSGLFGAALSVYNGIGRGESMTTAIVGAVATVVAFAAMVRQIKHCKSGERGLEGLVIIFISLFITCLMVFLAMYALFESKSIPFTIGFGIIALLAFFKAVHRQVVYSR